MPKKRPATDRLTAEDLAAFLRDEGLPADHLAVFGPPDTPTLADSPDERLETANASEAVQPPAMPGIAFDVDPQRGVDSGFRSLRVSVADYERAKRLRARLLQRGAGELPDDLRAKLLAATDGGTRAVSMAVIAELAFDLLEERIGE